MPCRAAFPLDDVPTEVFLGCQRVVSCAAQRQVRRNVLASSRKRLHMMQLQVTGFAAALAAPVDVTAAAGIARKNLAFHVGWNVSCTLARC